MARFIATDSGMESFIVPQIGGNCDCKLCATRKVCQAMDLKRDLPDNILNQLFHLRVLKEGKHLFHAGDELDALYVIKSGAFKTYLNNESGDEYVMSFYMPGEILGADAIATRKHELSAIALGTSAICAIPIKRIENEISRYPSNWLLKQASQQTMRESQTFLISIRNNSSAYARLAFFLIKLSGQHKVRGHSGREFKLDMKRQDIANYLGLTIETVSRVFSRLQEDGILAIDRRQITIVKFDKLIELADSQHFHEKLSA